jgi:hypothetical protein
VFDDLQDVLVGVFRRDRPQQDPQPSPRLVPVADGAD